MLQSGVILEHVLQVCSIILALVLLIVAALSAVAVAVCRYQFWTYLQDASVSPAYVLRYCTFASSAARILGRL